MTSLQQYDLQPLDVGPELVGLGSAVPSLDRYRGVSSSGRRPVMPFGQAAGSRSPDRHGDGIRMTDGVEEEPPGRDVSHDRGSFARTAGERARERDGSMEAVVSSAAETDVAVTGASTLRWISYGSGALDALAEAISTAKGADPLQRVTVIVPTKVSGLGLRRELSSRPAGSVGVGYLVVAQLAELLAAPRVADEGLRPLTPDVRREVVRESLRQAPGSLGHLADHPATARVIDEAFAAIRQATAAGGETELLGGLRERGGLHSMVADAYAVFRRLTEPTRYDEHDLALLSAEVAVADPEVVRREVGPVIVYLPTQATPATGRLLQALTEVAPVTVLAGATDDAAADDFTAEVVARLTGMTVDAPPVSSPPRRAPIEAIVTPDAEEEVRQAARIVSRRLHDGGDLARLAILYRAEEPYATLVHEVLATNGIPHNGPTERTIRQTVAGRFLWDLWGWAADDHPRGELFDILGSVTVVHDGHRAPTEQWDRIARKARVLGGRDHWDRRLEGLARRNQEQLDAGVADWLRERLERERDRARELRGFALGLADALEPPTDLTWNGWSRWALAVLDTYLGRGRSGWPDADIDAEGSLRQQLTGLAQLDDLAGELGIAPHPVTSGDARAAVAAILDEPAGRVGRAGTGVYVGPLGTAGSLDLDHVIIVGAVEGQFPPAPRDSVLLPDADVAAIGAPPEVDHALAAAVSAIPSATTRRQAARQAFHRVLSASRKVTFTVPRADRREQRAKVPGPWLLELLTQQHGERVTVADLLEGSIEIRGVRSVASSIAGLREADVPGGVDEQRLRLLSDRVVAGGDLAEDPIVHSLPVVATGVDISRARRGAAFTEFDGQVTGAHEVLLDRLERPHAANALAAYATCPRQYLFKEILGLRPEDEPRRWLDVDALDRGTLIHDVLERWVAETLDDRPETPPSDAAEGGSEARLFEIFEAETERLEATGRTGVPELWAMERSRMRRRLQVWLAQQAAHLEGRGVAPAAVELSFGMGDQQAEPVTIGTANGATLLFRGKIDRIDASEDGRRVVVTDYKTSKPGRYSKLAEDITQGGSELQLPVYGLAAAREHPEADIAVGYWHLHDEVKKEPNLVAFDESARARTQEVLDRIAEGIATGVFPARPGSEVLYPRPSFEHCTWCVFDRICPSHAERSRASERDLDSDAAEVLLPIWDPASSEAGAAGEEPT